MTETLTLNDGTVFAGHCIEVDDILWVYLDNSTLTETVENFNIPDKTCTIEFNQYGTTVTITGYTHMFCVREESGTMVSAGLKKA